jgi:hypothetical protein
MATRVVTRVIERDSYIYAQIETGGKTVARVVFHRKSL